MKRYTIVEYTHDFLKCWLKEGGVFVDATVGNGHDTEFLCKGVGSTGKVIGLMCRRLPLQILEKGFHGQV